MAELTVKIRTEDDIIAYQIVTHLSFKHDVFEATYGGKTYRFDKKVEEKKPRHFLKEDFGKRAIIKR